MELENRLRRELDRARRDVIELTHQVAEGRERNIDLTAKLYLKDLEIAQLRNIPWRRLINRIRKII